MHAPRLTWVAMLAAIVAVESPAAGATMTERVSVDSAGGQGNSGSDSPAISADGRYVAFSSFASNLIADDTNGTFDLFVHDRQTGATERIIEFSSFPAISGDGRHVAFSSFASNLVPDDTNNQSDVFVHDRRTDLTERVSVDSAGGQANSASDLPPAISGDGRHVAFSSFASNLVAGDNAGQSDVFVHDLRTGLTERVSVDSAGNEANGSSYQPSIDAKGRHMAFHSFASNLVAGDTNDAPDVFVQDRRTGLTERVSVDSAGGQANEFSFDPAISANGRYVAFQSFAPNLVPDDSNGAADVFVHDRRTGVTERISVNMVGGQANSGSGFPEISADGRHVAFYSTASNLVAGDTNNLGDVFVHDRRTGLTERVSVDSAGGQANSGSDSPAISADGRHVAFSSFASNLVPDDTNNQSDVFVRER